MKPDIYTKAILTVVAVMLSVIALKPLISPITAASAQAQPARGSVSSKAVPVTTNVGWEYKLVDISRPGGFGLQDYKNMAEDGQALNGTDWFGKAEQLGAQGWELVSVTAASNLSGQNFAGATSEMMFLFKRQLH